MSHLVGCGISDVPLGGHLTGGSVGVELVGVCDVISILVEVSVTGGLCSIEVDQIEVVVLDAVQPESEISTHLWNININKSFVH